MFRKLVTKSIQPGPKGFHFRGHEVKRIETFSDAVFAFAVTLLIVSLEVPKTFEELLTTMRGFFAFAISFTFLIMIWYEQYVFFRRYGMEDIVTIVLNAVLMFIVLFYVYPLKFLFTLLFSSYIYGANTPFHISDKQFPDLMLVYSIGYIAIYSLFFLMYCHALRKKDALQLTKVELFDTRTKVYSNFILILIGLLSVCLVKVLPPGQIAIAGIIYCIIGPVFFIYFSVRGRKRKKVYSNPVPVK